MNFAIVGAGFSGAVLARELSKLGHQVTVFESRTHLAGNCHTERDEDTGIIVHKYGPHIFHTDNEEVWAYVNQFAEFMPFVNRVKTISKGNVYGLPINLHTINQYFGKTFNPQEAEEFIQSLASKDIEDPKSFEEQALKFVGEDLYKAFFYGYTMKQWGIDPKSLPASILKRLPLRFNYNDNYFNHKYQGIPKEGYTALVQNILDDSSIDVLINTKFKRENLDQYDHVFYTGPLDAWFDHSEGRLGYRTLDFVKETYEGDYQGCAVMNYADQEVPFTRISEHKHFSPWEKHTKTVIFKEYSRECGETDVPYYPIRLVEEKRLLRVYYEKALKEKQVSFLGRLGTYRYLDMDVTIEEALTASREIINRINSNQVIPPFFVEPL